MTTCWYLVMEKECQDQTPPLIQDPDLSCSKSTFITLQRIRQRECTRTRLTLLHHKLRKWLMLLHLITKLTYIIMKQIQKALLQSIKHTVCLTS